MQSIDLKRFRKDKNLTQFDVAELFKCKQNFISNIEAGIKSIPADKLDILQSKYGDISEYIIDSDKAIEVPKSAAKNQDVISMPADVWAVISNQAKSLEVKDRQTSEAMKQTSEVIELLKEQLKKGQDVENSFRAANSVVVEDE